MPTTGTNCIRCNKKIKEHIKDAYKCKCLEYVCHKHRLDHGCTYNYHAEHKSRLSDNLKPVIGDRIQKI